MKKLKFRLERVPYHSTLFPYTNCYYWCAANAAARKWCRNNPSILRRSNIELINHQTAHF